MSQYGKLPSLSGCNSHFPVIQIQGCKITLLAIKAKREKRNDNFKEREISGKMVPGVKERERDRKKNRVHPPLQSNLFVIDSAGTLHNLGPVPENPRQLSNCFSASLFVRDDRSGLLNIRET